MDGQERGENNSEENVSQKESNKLAQKDALDLERLLYLYIPFFGPGRISGSILCYLIRRTIGFNIFETWTRAREFLYGSGLVGYAGCLAKDRNCEHRAKRDLIDRNILYCFQERDSGLLIRRRIRLNIPGMLDFIVTALEKRIESYPGLNRDESFEKCLKRTKEIRTAVEACWEKHRWPYTKIIPAKANWNRWLKTVEDGKKKNEERRRREQPRGTVLSRCLRFQDVESTPDLRENKDKEGWRLSATYRRES